jgi:hypothetical protein
MGNWELGIGNWELSKNAPCLPHFPYLLTANSYHSKAYIEIENPFAQDSNDLPLVEICFTLLQNIEDLISFNLSDRTILDASESHEVEHLCVCLTS